MRSSIIFSDVDYAYCGDFGIDIYRPIKYLITHEKYFYIVIYSLFSDMDLTSVNNSITDYSNGFCMKLSNVNQTAKETICGSEAISPSSPLVKASVSPNRSSDLSVNIFSALTASDSFSDLENIYNKKLSDQTFNSM